MSIEKIEGVYCLLKSPMTDEVLLTTLPQEDYRLQSKSEGRTESDLAKLQAGMWSVLSEKVHGVVGERFRVSNDPQRLALRQGFSQELGLGIPDPSRLIKLPIDAFTIIQQNHKGLFAIACYGYWYEITSAEVLELRARMARSGREAKWIDLATPLPEDMIPRPFFRILLEQLAGKWPPHA